jgi:hypothetical protein
MDDIFKFFRKACTIIFFAALFVSAEALALAMAVCFLLSFVARYLIVNRVESQVDQAQTYLDNWPRDP